MPSPDGIPVELFDRIVKALLGELVFASAEDQVGDLFDERFYLSEVSSWASNRAGELIKDLTPRDEEILKGAIEQANREGWSMGKLRDSLSGAYDPTRASVIARTESAFARNAGHIVRWKADGFDWFVVVDAPGCLPKGHRDGAAKPDFLPGTVQEDREANGQVWTADQVLEYLLGHPNCERAFRPATPAELEKIREYLGQEAA